MAPTARGYPSPPVRQIETQTRQQAARLGELTGIRRWLNGQGDIGAASAHHDRNGRIAGDGPQQIDLQLLDIGNRVIADSHDLVVGTDAGRGGRTVEAHLPHDRLDDLDARHGENRIEKRGKNEIHGRAGEQHRNPVRDGAAREGAMQLRGIDIALALVEQLHIPAERNRGQAVLRAIPIVSDSRQQRFAEADTEAQHLEAKFLRDPVVPEFVHSDQYPDRNQEGGDEFHNHHA